jgi:hypothetical protein
MEGNDCQIMWGNPVVIPHYLHIHYIKKKHITHTLFKIGHTGSQCTTSVTNFIVPQHNPIDE